MPRSHSIHTTIPGAGLACSSRSWPADGPGLRAGDSGWTVRTFDVTLAVRPDAALDVTELIDANFEVAKHGIYREIPIRYAVGMQQYALRFRLLGVDDGAGQSYHTAVSYEENRVRIRIGDAARTLGGPVRYRIRYRVERAILWEGTRAWGGEEGNRDHAVLRWNATGTEWGVPIARSTVTVKLPRELDDSQVVYDAWTGAYGAKNKDFTKRRVDARDPRLRDRCAAARRRDHRRGDDARRRGRPAGLDAARPPRGWPTISRMRSSPRLWACALPPGSTAAEICRAAARSSSTTSRPTNSHRPRSAP